MDERFTIVFEGDIRKFVGNPLKTETPFGIPYTVAVGDIIEQLNELQDSSTGAPSRPEPEVVKLLRIAREHIADQHESHGGYALVREIDAALEVTQSAASTAAADAVREKLAKALRESALHKSYWSVDDKDLAMRAAAALCPLARNDRGSPS